MSLKVRGVTCDGLSANRRFFKLHDMSSNIVYKVRNKYAPEGHRDIFFFSDPPHLIKTTRNAWASTKRHLWVCILYTSVCMNYKILVQWKRDSLESFEEFV